MVFWLIISLAWVFVNLWTFAIFAVDKRSAGTKEWRVSESSLLTLALIGGSFGAICGQYFLRHKTRKEPFRTQLFSIIAIQLAIVSFLIFRLLFAKS